MPEHTHHTLLAVMTQFTYLLINAHKIAINANDQIAGIYCFVFRSRIEELLNDLKRQYSQSSRYKFTNGQYLALCLYMLEKNTNFTGDGVWFDERNVRQQSSHLLKDRNISIGTEDEITAKNIDNDSSIIDSDLNHLHDKDGHEMWYDESMT